MIYYARIIGKTPSRVMEMIALGLVYRPTAMRVPLHGVSYLGYGSRGSCLYGNAGSSHSAGALWCVI